MTTTTKDGMTLKLSPSTDSRIRKVDGNVLICRSAKAARELAYELRQSWGLKASESGKEVTL